MIQYKNISYSAKTFYGVKFEPGEIKEVPGYINDAKMVRVQGKLAKTFKPTVQNTKVVNESDSTRFETRGRKKKSNDTEKDSFAEATEIKLETITQEETSNGNHS